MSKKQEEKVVKMQYRYICPKCTNTAIETSNKMLGVDVDCKNCGNRITLDNVKNYIQK